MAAAIASSMRDAAEAAGVTTSELAVVGVGSPGEIGSASGMVTSARNLPGCEGSYPLAAALEDDLGARVALGNDVQVATDAEAHLGAGRPFTLMLGVFWGTGVGGGIILNRAPWLGLGGAELLKIMKKRDRPRMTSSIWATALKREDRLACKLIAKAVEALGDLSGAIGASLLSLSAPAPAG